MSTTAPCVPASSPSPFWALALTLLLTAACGKESASPATAPPAISEARQSRIRTVVDSTTQRLDALTQRIDAAKGDEPDLAGIHRAYCAPAADTDWPDDAIVKLLKVDELIAEETNRGGAILPDDLAAIKAQVQALAKDATSRIGTAVKPRCKRTPSDSEVLAQLDGKLGPGYGREVSLDYAHWHLKDFWKYCQESFTDLLPAMRAGVEEQKRQHPEWTSLDHHWYHAFIFDLIQRVSDRGHGKKVKCAQHIPWVTQHPVPPFGAKP